MIEWLYSPHISTVLHAFENHRSDGGIGWASICGRPERGQGTEIDDDGRCLACKQILEERACGD